MNRLAAAVASTFLIFGASEAQAAIFRIQGATTGSKAVITHVSGTYQISGEFKFLTDYRDSSGNVVNAGGSVTNASLQAWNITVYDSTGLSTLKQYTFGYGDAGIPDDGSTINGSVTANSFTLNKSNNLTIATNGNFNTAIGDSVGGTLESLTLSTNTRYDAFGTTTVATGQVVFVPFAPALAALVPVFALSAKLRKSSL